ncbi:hypothetical protein CLV56_3800 [Mumia flava]|uniref:Uncharacterized protein n=1 Tax=Mumia flava TaxID=1348852 RepID=A0A2M9B8K6_9ACTN|nr:hypothetical protein CLV56_3800 [Mumia flava]
MTIMKRFARRVGRSPIATFEPWPRYLGRR